ncbi:MAG: heme ABC exporter ATP-binding protein CcmA [Notoacmeibacter sp.]
MFNTSLTVENLSASRGGFVLFENVSFHLNAGEALRITGPNGSGKTTLMRCLAGLVRPDSGKVIGQSESAFHYLGHLNAMKLQLTVNENLSFWAKAEGGNGIDAAMNTLNLSRLKDVPFGVLSSGQKRRTAFARLLLSSRPVWFLDEPAVGLDTASVAILNSILEQHLANGGIVLAATHTTIGSAVWHTLDLQPARP